MYSHVKKPKLLPLNRVVYIYFHVYYDISKVGDKYI